MTERVDLIYASLEHAARLARARRGRQDTYLERWNEGLQAILCTLAPEHVALLDEAFEVADGEVVIDHASPAGKLDRAIDSRIVDRIGWAPGAAPRHPDRPLAMPRAVAEIYLAEDGHGVFVTEVEECSVCRYLAPQLGGNRVVRWSDGAWRFADGVPASSGPHMTDTTATYCRHRVLRKLDACPLCGGDLRQRSDWARRS